MLDTSDANHRLFESAGYAWDEHREAWVHPRSGRALSASVSRSMTTEQVAEWLKAAETSGSSNTTSGGQPTP
jgi:hypothetical protein